MKHFAFGSLSTLILAGIAWLGVNSLAEAIGKSSVKRFIADTATIAVALDQYKSEDGSYPISMGKSEILNTVLVPRYIRFMPSWGIRYFSDGVSYSLLVRPSGEGPYSLHAFGALELHDGKWVSW